MRLDLDYEEGEAEYKKATGLVPLKDGEKSSNLHEYIPTVQAPPTKPVD